MEWSRRTYWCIVVIAILGIIVGSIWMVSIDYSTVSFYGSISSIVNWRPRLPVTIIVYMITSICHIAIISSKKDGHKIWKWVGTLFLGGALVTLMESSLISIKGIVGELTEQENFLVTDEPLQYIAFLISGALLLLYCLYQLIRMWIEIINARPVETLGEATEGAIDTDSVDG